MYDSGCAFFYCYLPLQPKAMVFKTTQTVIDALEIYSNNWLLLLDHRIRTISYFVVGHSFIRLFHVYSLSCSILAFTIERFIAITRPMLAQKVCTMGRAKKVIYCVWLVSFLYCAPWLGLTKVVRDKEQPDLETCDFRISKEQYVYFFMTDLVLFYFVPLLISAFVYTKIAWIVRSRSYKAGLTKNGRDVALEQSSSGLNRTTTIGRRHGDHGSESPKFGHSFKSMASLRGSTHNTSKSNNAQVYLVWKKIELWHKYKFIVYNSKNIGRMQNVTTLAFKHIWRLNNKLQSMKVLLTAHRLERSVRKK